MIKHRIWLTAETARSFLPVLGDDNGDFDPVGERLERTSDYNRNAIYVINFRSKNFSSPTHQIQTLNLSVYLKHIWSTFFEKKKPESLTQNHALHVCMYCIFKQAMFPVDVRHLYGLSAPLVCLSIQLPLVHKPWAVEGDFCGSEQEISNLSVTW